MAFTDYGKNSMLEFRLKDNPTYVGLHTASGEVSASDYKRQKLSFLPASNGQIVTSEDVFFPIATSLWGEISSIGLYDESGELLAETKPEWIKTIDPGSQYHIPKGMGIARLI